MTGEEDANVYWPTQMKDLVSSREGRDQARKIIDFVEKVKETVE